MENAAEALKIAFALFAFVLAITVTFSLISQAKSTSDYVLYYSDKTNFYENLTSSTGNRKVLVSEVISTLYRYSDESISITVDLGDKGSRTFESSITSDNIEKDLSIYINEILLNTDYVPINAEFEEEFVEVPITGIYERGEDDTEITLSSGKKMVYITYILQ